PAKNADTAWGLQLRFQCRGGEAQMSIPPAGLSYDQSAAARSNRQVSGYRPIMRSRALVHKRSHRPGRIFRARRCAVCHDALMTTVKRREYAAKASPHCRGRGCRTPYGRTQARKMTKPGLRAGLRRETGRPPLVHDVDDLTAGRLDEIDVVVRVHIAVLGHGRTPFRRNRAEFHVGRKPRPDAQALPDGDRSNALLHHVVLDARALLRREADSRADRTDLDTDALGE